MPVTSVRPERPVALDGCRVWRPGLGVEMVAAAPADRSFPPRMNESLGVCLKLGPGHAVVADGRRLEYPAHAICVRPPRCVWSSASTGPTGFISIDVEPAQLPRGMARSAPMAFLPRDRLPELSGILAALDGGAPGLRREEAVAELVLAVGEVVAAEEPREHGPRPAVARARELLAARLAAPPSLDELASATGLNKFSLLRRFKRELGITPHAYLVALRVDRARELLARGSGPVEVAGRLGFADQSHFTRAFRARVGLTPSRYSRQVRGPRYRGT